MGDVTEFRSPASEESSPLTAAEIEVAEVAERQAATNAIREAAVAAQQPPMMTQKYIAFGLVNGEKISQEFQINVPLGMPNHDQANLMLWDAIGRVGGLTVKVDASHYKLYPIKMFEGALDLEVGIVTGNSIV